MPAYGTYDLATLAHKYWSNWSTIYKVYELKGLLQLNVRRIEYPRQSGKSTSNPETTTRALDYDLPWIYSILKRGIITIDTSF